MLYVSFPKVPGMHAMFQLSIVPNIIYSLKFIHTADIIQPLLP